MRKIVLCLLILFVVTGCQSKDEYFTKTCTNKVKTDNLIVFEEKTITYNNKDEVINEVIVRTYTDKSDKNSINAIKKAAVDYNNELAGSDAIEIRILNDSDDEYKFEYNIDVQNLNSLELEMFNIEKNSIKYFKKLKKDGIECK